MDFIAIVLAALVCVAGCGFAGVQWGQGVIPFGRWNKLASPLIAGGASAPLALALSAPIWFPVAVALGFYLYRFPGPGVGFPKIMDDIPPGRMNWRAFLTRLVVRDWRKPLEADWTETRVGSIVYHALRSLFAVVFLGALASPWGFVQADLAMWPLVFLAARGLAYWVLDGRARSWNFEAYVAEGGDGLAYGLTIAVMMAA